MVFQGQQPVEPGTARTQALRPTLLDRGVAFRLSVVLSQSVEGEGKLELAFVGHFLAWFLMCPIEMGHLDP